MIDYQDIQGALTALESSLSHHGDAELLQRLQHGCEALAKGAADPDLYIQLAELSITTQQPNLARDFLQLGLRANPTSAILHFRFADLMFQHNRKEAAVLLYKGALKYQPDMADAYLNMSVILMMEQRISEVIELLEDAIEKCPHAQDVRPASMRVRLAEAVRSSGDMARAVKLLREALAIAPWGHAYIYQQLAYTRKFTELDEDIRQMEYLFNDSRHSAEDRSRLGFALGKAFEDLAEYEQSFYYYQKANRLHRSSVCYDIRETRTSTDSHIENFNQALFSRFQGFGSASHTPIFIVGMPRSGTTLLEKILAAHPEVYGAGELYVIPDCVKMIWADPVFGGMEYPAGVDRLEPSLVIDAAEHYLRDLRRVSQGEWQRTVDKLPHNFVHVGLIKLLFPNSKIIHCRRHPMDTCLSLYKYLFGGSHPYCYDLVELGRYYRMYQELMAHWHDVLPGFIYDIEYESLVNSPGQEIEKLLNFCELPWHDACLEHHKSGNRSITASSLQVNRPIYRDSLDYWRNYMPFLQPLEDALKG